MPSVAVRCPWLHRRRPAAFQQAMYRAIQRGLEKPPLIGVFKNNTPLDFHCHYSPPPLHSCCSSPSRDCAELGDAKGPYVRRPPLPASCGSQARARKHMQDAIGERALRRNSNCRSIGTQIKDALPSGFRRACHRENPAMGRKQNIHHAAETAALQRERREICGTEPIVLACMRELVRQEPSTVPGEQRAVPR